jgi:hypothetical protein
MFHCGDDSESIVTHARISPTRDHSLPLWPASKWGVRVVALEGPFALGFRRPVAVAGVYPNAVIEKAWGVRATTRDWATLEKVGRLVR